MATAIKGKNIKGLRVYNSHFIGKFDPAIDLENAEDTILANNRYSDSGLNNLVSTLAYEISHSVLSEEDKRELFSEITNYLNSSNRSSQKEESLKSRILKYVGDKAVDCFVQAAAIAASRIL